MTTPKTGTVSEEDVKADIERLRSKLHFTFEQKDRVKLIKQIELLEDAVVVYRINQGESSLES